MTAVEAPPLPFMMDVPLDKLRVDESYQRPPDERWVRRTVSRFDPLQLKVLLVNDRGDGSYWVFDGQGRMEVLRRVGWKEAPCLVHTITRDEEARLFVEQRSMRGLSAYDRFNAQLFRREPDAVALTLAVRAEGFRIVRTPTTSSRAIRAVDALERVYAQGGAERVRWVLRVLKDWVPEDGEVIPGALMQGLSYWRTHWVAAGGGDPDFERLTASLAKRTPTTLMARANALMKVGSGGGRSPKYVAEAITELYHTGLREGSASRLTYK